MKDSIPGVINAISISVGVLFGVTTLLGVIDDFGWFYVTFLTLLIFSSYSGFQLHRAKSKIEEINQTLQDVRSDHKDLKMQYEQKKDVFESSIHESNHIKRYIKFLKASLENEKPRSEEGKRIIRTLLAQLEEILKGGDHNE